MLLWVNFGLGGKWSSSFDNKITAVLAFLLTIWGIFANHCLGNISMEAMRMRNLLLLWGSFSALLLVCYMTATQWVCCFCSWVFSRGNSQTVSYYRRQGDVYACLMWLLHQSYVSVKGLKCVITDFCWIKREINFWKQGFAVHSTTQLCLRSRFWTYSCCTVKQVLFRAQVCWLSLLMLFVVQCSQKFRHQNELGKSVVCPSSSLSRLWQPLQNGRKIVAGVFHVFLQRLF